MLLAADVHYYMHGILMHSNDVIAVYTSLFLTSPPVMQFLPYDYFESNTKVELTNIDCSMAAMVKPCLWCFWNQNNQLCFANKCCLCV